MPDGLPNLRFSAASSNPASSASGKDAELPSLCYLARQSRNQTDVRGVITSTPAAGSHPVGSRTRRRERTRTLTCYGTVKTGFYNHFLPAHHSTHTQWCFIRPTLSVVLRLCDPAGRGRIVYGGGQPAASPRKRRGPCRRLNSLNPSGFTAGFLYPWLPAQPLVRGAVIDSCFRCGCASRT